MGGTLAHVDSVKKLSTIGTRPVEGRVFLHRRSSSSPVRESLPTMSSPGRRRGARGRRARRARRRPPAGPIIITRRISTPTRKARSSKASPTTGSSTRPSGSATPSRSEKDESTATLPEVHRRDACRDRMETEPQTS